MITYLLDTDTLTLYQRGHVLLAQRINALPPDDICVAVISVEEQLAGWYARLRQAKKRAEIADIYLRFTNAIRFLAGFDLISYTEPAIIRYESLRKTHRQIGKNDLRIAAIALESGATVVSRNVRDFGQIAGLTVRDWSQ